MGGKEGGMWAGGRWVGRVGRREVGKLSMGLGGGR